MKRSASGDPLAPAASATEGNANGSEAAVGPVAPGPSGV
jgi:hypothetical protein